MDFKEQADIHKLLSNPIRLEILTLLLKRPYTLKELQDVLKLRKPNISQHLQILRLSRVVRVERGAVYHLADPGIKKFLK